MLVLVASLVSCQYKTAPEFKGHSDALEAQAINLGGVLAESVFNHGELADSLEQSPPIAIEGIFSLQEKAQQLIDGDGTAISDSLMTEWQSMQEEVWLSFETLSTEDLIHWRALNDSLLKYTGSLCFADELEKLFYNSQNSEVTNQQAVKSVVYTRRYDRIYVNLFGNSTLDFDHTTGGTMRLVQETDYPFDGKIRFWVETNDTRYMDLFIRIPQWTRYASVTAKGVKYPTYPGEYTEVATKWKQGDTIEVVLGMQPRVETNELDQFAFAFGPLLLSTKAEDIPKGEKVDGDPMKYLQLVSPPGKMTTFTFSGYTDHTLVLQPYLASEDSTARTAWLPN